MNKTELSVVVPTYNESKNIEELVSRIHKALSDFKIEEEIIVVDDLSPDGTADIATRLAKIYPVRVHLRKERLGPGPAIVDGISLAQAPVICVMDADLSHPPEALPYMYDLIAQKKARLVIGSRHTKGGGTSKWVWYRRFFSWGARFLGRFLTPVKDLTSGYFMFDRGILEGVEIKPIGCKVGLELMVKGNHQGKVLEYPIVFVERAAGESKMGWQQTYQYLLHLLALTRFKLMRRK
ncbi:MAG: polyprenol monophosphomannose synthase [Candidatus Margulisiibacteriota bacterium]